MLKVSIGEQEREYPAGTTLMEISREFQEKHDTPIVVATVDGRLKDLGYRLKRDCALHFYDLGSESGNKVYQRSLLFLLMVAAQEVFPRAQLYVQNSLSKGIYCRLDLEPALTKKELKKIEERMHYYVEKDIPFVKKMMDRKEVLQLYQSYGFDDKAKLLAQLPSECTGLYYLGNKFGYFYRTMVPSTGYLKLFTLTFYSPGFILFYPQKENPKELPAFIENPKLASVFTETRRWANIIKCNYISSLNEYIANDNVARIINISEALHEKKISQIADQLTKNEDLRLVCIAGPSSSGKTTFTQRLSVQLQVNGHQTESISIDDYFIDVADRPRGDNGVQDFESLDIVNVPLFRKHLEMLFDGEEIAVPGYDFINGRSIATGKTMRLAPRQILLIEGIHGLNESLTSSVFKKNKAKIYINALTQLGIDYHNRLPTTDARLMRRIVRDHHTRGRTALETLRSWSSVRKGEEGNIFPYNEEADIIFNSSLVYELSVLRNYLIPLLEEIGQKEPEYHEAQRLIRLISFFYPLKEGQIPFNSLLREFIGKTDYI